jgi:lipid-binding SYLF domain-containing protein
MTGSYGSLEEGAAKGTWSSAAAVAVAGAAAALIAGINAYSSACLFLRA